jgi:hypothetical protein
MKSEFITILSHGQYIESIYNLIGIFISIISLGCLSLFLIKNKDVLNDKFHSEGLIDGGIYLSCMFFIVVSVLSCLHMPSEIICIANPDYCGLKILVGK